MFDFEPENIQGDTNKLLYSILMELRKLNKPLHPMIKDTVAKKKPKPKDKPVKLEKDKQIIGGD